MRYNMENPSNGNTLSKSLEIEKTAESLLRDEYRKLLVGELTDGIWDEVKGNTAFIIAKSVIYKILKDANQKVENQTVKYCPLCEVPKERHGTACGEFNANKILNFDKGEYNGKCNRMACTTIGANWFNHYTEKYYCASCAHEINRVNHDYAMKEYGHELLTFSAQKQTDG